MGYQSRNGPYGSIDSDEPSDGLVTIVVEPVGGKESPLTEQDRANVQWWLDHEAEVTSAVPEGLLAEYPRLQELYGYEGAERATYMPDVSRTEEFRPLIGLHNVHFVPLLKEGLPYVGYEFGCAWDGEHGLGVLTHGSRVVEVGAMARPSRCGSPSGTRVGTQRGDPNLIWMNSKYLNSSRPSAPIFYRTDTRVFEEATAVRKRVALVHTARTQGHLPGVAFSGMFKQIKERPHMANILKAAICKNAVAPNLQR